jgi:hypothetical protein
MGKVRRLFFQSLAALLSGSEKGFHVLLGVDISSRAKEMRGEGIPCLLAESSGALPGFEAGQRGGVFNRFFEPRAVLGVTEDRNEKGAVLLRTHAQFLKIGCAPAWSHGKYAALSTTEVENPDATIPRNDKQIFNVSKGWLDPKRARAKSEGKGLG